MKKLWVVLLVGVGFWAVLIKFNAEPVFKKGVVETQEKQPKPEFPGEAAAYMAELRATPAGQNPAHLVQQAANEIKARRAARQGAGTLPNFRFEDFGPGNLGGRIRALVVKEDDGDTLVIGGVDGGVWKSTDGGQTWGAIDDFLPNLAISCAVTDPDNNNRIFMGTGEGFFNVDAARGMGIFQSDDFGDSWTHLPSTLNANFNYVNRIARIPGSNILLAATRQGIYRSTDLGVIWNEVSGFSTSGRGFVDIKVDPSNTSRIYASHFGSGNPSRFLMRSTNDGLTWTQLGAAEGMPTTNLGRTEIGIGNDGVIYASVSNSSDQTLGLYRSPAGGNAFVKTASNTPFIERQAWYDLICGVNPTDSNEVFIGAVDVYRTTDGGTTITKITQWNPGAGQIPTYVHADLHAVTFHPSDANTLWIGCDGGIFKSSDGGSTYIPLNNDLRIAQFYGIAAHPDGSRAISGLQDNGTLLYFGLKPLWLKWASGDGGFCAWDQQQPNFVYGSTPFGGMFGSNDGGLNTASITLPDTNGAAFIQPFTVDPNDGSRMMVGTDNIFYSENVRALAGSTWVDASGALGSVSATTFSPHNSQIAYAGTSSGQVHKSTNLGAGNTFTNITNNLPGNGTVTWIEVDVNDISDNTVYVTYGSFLSNRIWRSTDGGANWTSLQGDMPNLPLYCVSVDPTNANRLFVGSELGLWSTDLSADGATTWEQYAYGTAWARVMQMRWVGDDTFWIGTHGRGMFKAYRSPIEIEFSNIVETNCDLDAFIDEGETVELPVTVFNRGGSTVTSLVVEVTTPYVGLSVDAGSLNFGSLAAGASQTMNAQLTLNSLDACLDVTTVDADATFDAGVSSALLTVTLGSDADVQTGTLVEGAEAATTFTVETLVGTDDWVTTNTQAHTGTNSWFASDEPALADKSLISPWMDVQFGSTLLDFWLYYDLEGDASQYWDGAVLELRTENGDWTDIGLLSTVPYDGQLFNNSSLEYRLAWSGVQTTWRHAMVDLGSTYNGQKVQFRFRVACDSGAANVGFWVDDIQISNVSWTAGLNCDDVTCVTCFATTNDALQAILLRLGAGQWPMVDDMTTYVEMLNNICP